MGDGALALGSATAPILDFTIALSERLCMSDLAKKRTRGAGSANVTACLPLRPWQCSERLLEIPSTSGSEDLAENRPPERRLNALTSVSAWAYWAQPANR